MSTPSVIIARGGEPIGYFVLTYGFDLELGGRQATVTELYLRPVARRSGIGTTAIDFIEQHLTEHRITAYELQVEGDNTEARSFYTKHGFRSHDRIPLTKYIVDRSEKAPAPPENR